MGNFKIADLDNETTRLLPSVEWIDAMNDFVPGKRNKEILTVLSKDKGRLRYLMVCNGYYCLNLLFVAIFSLRRHVNVYSWAYQHPM